MHEVGKAAYKLLQWYIWTLVILFELAVQTYPKYLCGKIIKTSIYLPYVCLHYQFYSAFNMLS